MRRKIVVSGVAMVALTTAGMLTALAPPVSASTGGVIKVAYENYGTNITLNTLMQKAGAEFAKAYPGWTVDLEPIAAPENPYYTKLDLMSQSASTAPDVLYEDTFLVNSDIAAGYLAPLDSYLSKWSGWNSTRLPPRPPPRASTARSTGSPWGPIPVACGTTRWCSPRPASRSPGSRRPGLDVISAAARRSRRPSRASPQSTSTAASAPAKASSMQGFEMFLYGTNNSLYDSTTNKWEEAGAGLAGCARRPSQTLYGQDNLAASLQDSPRDHQLAAVQ